MRVVDGYMRVVLTMTMWLMLVAERKSAPIVLCTAMVERMNPVVLHSVLSSLLHILRVGYSAPCGTAYTGGVIELPEAKL